MKRFGADGFLSRLYPPGQMKRYLLIDIIVCVFLFYHVLRAGSPVGPAGTFGLLALYLLLFYLGLWSRNWRLVLVVAAGCGLMAVFAVYYNLWIILFATVFADFLGRVRTRLQLAAGMAAFVAMYAVVNAALFGNMLVFLQTVQLPFLIIQLAVPFVVRVLDRSESLKHELASANERLALYAQEEERRRLARDLHDTLGQTLTMIKVKSELALRTMDRHPEQARREMQEVVRTARAALKQVRGLVTAMRHVPLEQELDLGRSLLAGAGIGFERKPCEPRPPLSKTAETMMALAVRESLTNVARHSGASRCVVTETCQDGWYEICIDDDGGGMAAGAPEETRTEPAEMMGKTVTETAAVRPDAAAADRPGGQPPGHGLATMQERLRLLQGEARIGPSPLGGVRVTLAIPVRQSAERDELA